jgi:hypothetical protein
VVWNDGTGKFTTSSQLTYAGSNSCSLNSETTAVRDIDGDGRADLLQSCSQRLIVHRQTAARTFTSKEAIAFDYYYPGQFQFEDLDGDGALDLIAYPANGNPLHVFLWNKAAYTYEKKFIYDVPFRNAGVLFDWSGDGRPDLVLGGGSWAQGKAGGQLALPPLFALQTGSASPVYLTGAAWVDVDGDGARDLVGSSFSGGALLAYSFNGSGPNAKRLTLPFDYRTQTLNGSLSAQAFDLDRDGTDELVVISSGQSPTSTGYLVDMHLSAVTAQGLQKPVTLRWPAGAFASAIAQFGGDQNLDVATLRYVQGTGAVIDFFVLGAHQAVTATPSFTMATVTRYPESITAVDYDQDGLADLLVNFTAPISVEVWRNLGNYTFQKALTLSPQTKAHTGDWYFFDVFAGNFSGTGRTDLWFYDLPDSAASLYQNLGGGALAAPADGLTLAGPWAADLNGDGVLDLVDSGKVYLGPFTPGPRATVSANLQIYGPESDLAKDGTKVLPVLRSAYGYTGYAGFVRRGPTPLP